MTVAYSGTSVTFNDNSIQSSAQIGMKNRIINGGFILNQRGYVSGAVLGASLAYGHDRWKGGAAATNTYTFTQAALGVNTTVTITAGSLMQVIEGCNLPEGGTYVLSWTGTAQGKIGAGAFSASGVTGTIVAGTNTAIEFGVGTVGNVQLEVGSIASSFDYRAYGSELLLCQRYFTTIARGTANCAFMPIPNALSESRGSAPFPVLMRSAPSVVMYDDVGIVGNVSQPGLANGLAVTTSSTGSCIRVVYKTTGSFMGGYLITFSYDASAEL